MLVKDTGICVRTVDYSESSQIVTLFTREHGKIGAIAKGSKRPKSKFGGAFEILIEGHVVFSKVQQGLSTITEFEQTNSLSGISASYSGVNIGLFAAELVNELTEESDPHPALYDSFSEFVTSLQQTKQTEHQFRILILFQLNLLSEIGLAPLLNACANCKSVYHSSWREIYFSSRANGLICRDCESHFIEKVRLDPKTAKFLTNIGSIESTQSETLKQVEKLLVYHFTEIMHKRPRMAAYVLS